MNLLEPPHGEKYSKNLIRGNKHTLNPPAVPALMTSSGFNAWIEAYVTRDAETVPMLSTPEIKFKKIRSYKVAEKMGNNMHQ